MSGSSSVGGHQPISRAAHGVATEVRSAVGDFDLSGVSQRLAHCLAPPAPPAGATNSRAPRLGNCRVHLSHRCVPRVKVRLFGVMELIDRGAERRLLDGVLRDVRSGHSRVLVLHGDPGVGKSALMQYAVIV